MKDSAIFEKHKYILKHAWTCGMIPFYIHQDIKFKKKDTEFIKKGKYLYFLEFFYLFIPCEMMNRNVIWFLTEFYFLLGVQLWRWVPEVVFTGLHSPVQDIPDDQLSNMGATYKTQI